MAVKQVKIVVCDGVGTHHKRDVPAVGKVTVDACQHCIDAVAKPTFPCKVKGCTKGPFGSLGALHHHETIKHAPTEEPTPQETETPAIEAPMELSGGRA